MADDGSRDPESTGRGRDAGEPPQPSPDRRDHTNEDSTNGEGAPLRHLRGTHPSVERSGRSTKTAFVFAGLLIVATLMYLAIATGIILPGA